MVATKKLSSPPRLESGTPNTASMLFGCSTLAKNAWGSNGRVMMVLGKNLGGLVSKMNQQASREKSV